MRAIFFDTETTGLPDWKEPSDAPQQPHIVQLAARLVDLETQKEVASMNVICAPNGWGIPPELTAIHGISEEYARQVGVEEKKALVLFHDMWAVADFRVAHNESFDRRIIRIALKRYGGHLPEHVHNLWKEGSAECTMKMSHEIMGGKWPKLAEAYQHFFGVAPPGQHTAIGDVDACQAIYFKLTEGNKADGTTTT